MGRFYYYDMIYTIDEGWMVKVFTKTGKPVWESSVYDDRNECLAAMAEFKFQETKKAAESLHSQLEHVQQKRIDAENQILQLNAELRELREIRDSFEEVRADKDEQLRLMQARLEAADRIIGELRAGGERAQNVEAMMAYFGWTQ